MSATSFLSQASTYESTYSASEVAAKVGFSIFGIGFGGSAGSSSSTLDADGTFQSRLNTEAKVVGGSAEGLQYSSSQHGNIHDWTLEDWSSWIESVKISPALINFHVTRVCDLFDGDTRDMCNNAVDTIYGRQQLSLSTISASVNELAQSLSDRVRTVVRTMFQNTATDAVMSDCEWVLSRTCPGNKVQTGTKYIMNLYIQINCCHSVQNALHWA